MNNYLGLVRSTLMEGCAFINGHYVDTRTQKTLPKICPVNGAILPSIAACQPEDIDDAVQAAKAAYRSRIWVDMPTKEKKSTMLRLADLMHEHINELALMDTIETGRSIKNFTRDSIPKSIEVIRWFAEAIDKIYDHAISASPHAFATVTREPLGVVGLITPWNDPLVVAAWKFAPALLMGNSVVLKPAEQSTYSILKVAQLAIQAGLPTGVFNVTPGAGEVAGRALALHKDVNAIFFTGSSTVGKTILECSGQSNMKKVGLECGGKSPFIISKHCQDLPQAAKVLAKNIFYNQGQICSAPSRLLLHSSIKQQFINLLLEEAQYYIPKDPFNIESEVGCLVSLNQKQRIESYIEQAKLLGCTVISPQYNPQYLPGECCLAPIIIHGVDPKSEFACEEIFGPVLSIITFENLGEAIDLANESKFGLAAAIWTDDINEAYHTSRRLESGIVHVNSYGEDDNTVPFGGVKESGIGKDKSIYAFDEYSSCKTTWMQFKNVSQILQH